MTTTTPAVTTTTPDTAITPDTATTAPLAQTAGATAVLELLERAETALLAACHSREVAQRHQHARLAALRGAAALVGARTTPRTTGSAPGPRSLWAVLPGVAPELAEWARFFATATRRTGTPSTREADDLLRQAETFLDLVRAGLGLPVSRHHGDLLLPATPMPTTAVPATSTPSPGSSP